MRQLLKKGWICEAERAEEAGAISVSLGERILRCETAPDYCLSAISYELELGE